MPILEHDDKKPADMDSKEKLARLVDLPSLPTLLMDALQHTTEKQNLSILADKIAQDPATVARILRIANSPFYGMSREIGSLREAIILLGVNRVRDMLISACFLKILPERHKDFDYPSFWHHSLAVADCARQLGMHTGLSLDIAFTAGLLHDIGRLVIVFVFPDEYSRLIKEPHPNRLETERLIMGFDHVEIGSKVAQRWNFPFAIQDAIEQHETPPAQGAAISLGLLVYTANLLIKETEQCDDFDAGQQEALIDVLELLDVSVEQSRQWVDTSQQFAEQILARF